IPLKKEISILLLMCFALYHFGYYIFYFSYRYKIETDWTTSTHDYEVKPHEYHLMEIPMSIPYLADQEDYQRVSASFEKNGKIYRVVKQRYAQDTLHLIYVPDVALRKLDLTVKGWIASLTEGDNQTTKNGLVLSMSFGKDYLTSIFRLALKSYILLPDEDVGFNFSFYQNINIDLTSPPPEVV